MVTTTVLLSLVVLVGMTVLALWLRRGYVTIGALAVCMYGVYYLVSNDQGFIGIVVAAIMALVNLFAFIKQMFAGEILE